MWMRSLEPSLLGDFTRTSAGPVRRRASSRELRLGCALSQWRPRGGKTWKVRTAAPPPLAERTAMEWPEANYRRSRDDLRCAPSAGTWGSRPPARSSRYRTARREARRTIARTGNVARRRAPGCPITRRRLPTLRAALPPVFRRLLLGRPQCALVRGGQAGVRAGAAARRPVP